MIPELGQLSLILALSVAILLGTLPLIGSFSGHRAWMALAPTAAATQFVLILIAYLCLTASFVQHDFSVLYVANNSNRSLPLVYRISGVWGGHEGSILLWCLTHAAWTAAVAWFSRRLPLVMLARVLAVLGLVSVGFLLFVLLTSNPFERLLPMPLDGASLNPLLQDSGMAIHPPMLYMGYVGFSVAFAFAIAALIGGQLDAATIRWMRPWTNVAWMFLTVGIALGSWWAYNELGWGGWWFWDPVENASFMPWLVGTALIHSLAASEKRGVFKAWTVLLAVLAFSLSLLGTFLVRSGVLTSVHSFASDPMRGLYILLFLGLVIGLSLLLFAFRGQRLNGGVGFHWLSRESGILLNNVMMSVACAAVLFGTLYPLFVDALGMGKISVGEPYFNAVFVPLMLPVLLTIGVGALLNWKRDRFTDKRVVLLVLAALAVVAGLGVMLLGLPHFSLGAWLSVSLALWIVATTLYGLYRRFRHRREALSAITHTPAAFWGMNLAHLGVAVFAIGVSLVTIYSEESMVRMAPGDEHTMSGYRFQLDKLEEVRGPNYSAVRAHFESFREGSTTPIPIVAEKRFYDARRDVMTEAGIDDRLSRDLFIALGEPLSGGAAWSVRVQIKPFVRWIWLGCLMMAVGAMLAALDRRYRRLARRERAGARQNTGQSAATAIPVAHEVATGQAPATANS
ncbi:MAG: c-type cytochrome biogenesis protein CcmF [Gammaproteobacteria bacterium]|nr:MAG: c-type cytochrome biogenesis protein CcmF [Gammaproteobacteria bacterium]